MSGAFIGTCCSTRARSGAWRGQIREGAASRRDLSMFPLQVRLRNRCGNAEEGPHLMRTFPRDFHPTSQTCPLQMGDITLGAGVVGRMRENADLGGGFSAQRGSEIVSGYQTRDALPNEQAPTTSDHAGANLRIPPHHGLHDPHTVLLQVAEHVRKLGRSVVSHQQMEPDRRLLLRGQTLERFLEEGR